MFTAPAPDVCVEDAPVTGLGGGTPTGGVYSGTGVTDDMNGMTFSFDPTASAPTGGNITVTYTFTDGNGCSDSATDDIFVNPICCELIVTCPPVDLGTIACGDPIPPAAMNEAEFEALGGDISDDPAPCGTLVIMHMDVYMPPADICGGRTMTRTYTLMDDNTTIMCTQMLTISAPAPPMIMCPGDMTVDCDASTDPMDTGIATATADCGQMATVTSNDVLVADPNGYIIERTWTATDDCGMQSMCTQRIVVIACELNITDPCMCIDNASVIDVDAGIGGDDGQFSEMVSITGPMGGPVANPNLVFEVIASTGAVDAFAPAPVPPAQTPGITIPIGTQLVYNMTTMHYELPFYHVDEMGYSMTIQQMVAGVPGQIFMISNRCAYPNPAFDPSVPDVLCPTSPDFTFGAIDLDGQMADMVTYTVNGMPATDFDPQTMAPGIYTVVMTYDGAADMNMGISPDGGITPAYPGCIQTVQKVMELSEPVNFMSCNDQLQASLGADCEVTLTAQMFFEDELFRCYDDYILTIDGVVGNVLTECGEYTVSVVDPVTGNSCWSTVIVEDKLGPVFPDFCTRDNPCPVSCALDHETIVADANAMVEAAITDCQEFEFTGPSKEIRKPIDCNEPDTLVLTYSAIDAKGNQSIGEYYYVLTPIDLSMVTFPGTWTGDCTSAGYPSETGMPTVGGLPLIFNGGSKTSQVCNVLATYTDNVLPACADGCENSRKIIRTFTLIDWCTDRIETGDQVIHLKDQDRPTTEKFEEGLSSVDPWTCQVDRYLLPELDASDNCTPDNQLHTIINGPAGIQVEQEADGRWYAYNVPKGRHIFDYYAKDCCGNISLVEPFLLMVIDEVKPVAIAKQFTVVSLTNDGDGGGVAKLFAESLDNGSYDRCTDVRLEIRRDGPPRGRYSCGEIGNDTYNNDGHESDLDRDPDDGRYVKFCCSDLDAKTEDVNGDGELDAGYIKVWLRVWDNANMTFDAQGNPIYGDEVEDGGSVAWTDNYNETWGYVKVEVSEQPVLEVTDETINCDWPYDEKFREGYYLSNEWKEGHVYTEGICDVRLDVRLDDSQVNTVCPGGYFELIYTATNRDSKGLTNIKRLRVYIENLDPTECRDINWPPSYTETTCLDAVTEPSLDWNSDACDLIGWTMRSDTFRFESGACVKVVNEYTVIDWCAYDDYYDFHNGSGTAGNAAVDDMHDGYFEGGHDGLDGILCQDPNYPYLP